jgi:hypothetical protein
MKKNDKNTILSFAALIIAIIACVTAIRSCSVSQEAINVSKSHFIAEKRPYLVISPAKFTKGDKYLEVEKTKDGKVKFHFQFKIENIGNVAATGIRSEVIPVIGNQGPIPTKIESVPHPLELGPGQHIYRNYVLNFAGNHSNYARSTVDSLKKNPAEIWEAFRYGSEVSKDVEYTVRIGYRISVDETNLLFQETKRTNDNIIVPRP